MIAAVDIIRRGLILVIVRVSVSKVPVFNLWANFKRVSKVTHTYIRAVMGLCYGSQEDFIQAAHVKFVETKCLCSKSIPKMDKSEPALHF